MSSEEQNNSPCCSQNALSLGLYRIGVLMVMAVGLILTISSRKNSVQDETALRGARGVERKETRVNLDAQARAQASSYGWRVTNQIVRLPVEKGMELVIAEYANQDTARDILKKRVAVVTPPAPAKDAKDAKK